MSKKNEKSEQKEKPKIDSLTPEQEAQLAVYVERYTEIGLSTERIEQDKAEAYASMLYKLLLGKPEPTVIITKGLTEAWDTTLICNLAQEKDITFKEASKLIKTEQGTEKVAFVWPYLDGQFGASYVAWFMFMKEVLGVTIDAQIEVFTDQLQFGPIYTLDKYCIFSDRMLTCSRNAQGQLHNDGGPSVTYADGTQTWHLNGVSVPRWLAENSENKIDVKEFSRIENAEVRREFVRKLGVDRICAELGSKVLDRHDGYELHEVDLGGTTGRWPYLKMKNPSIDVYHMECVDKSCKTVKEAIIWRNQSDLKPSQLT